MDNIKWKYYIVYDVWLAVELVVVYVFYIETRYTPLEEIAKHFDGEVSIPFKLIDHGILLTPHRMPLLAEVPLLRNPRSLPLRWVVLTPSTSTRSVLRLTLGRCKRHRLTGESWLRWDSMLGRMLSMLNTEYFATICANVHFLRHRYTALCRSEIARPSPKSKQVAMGNGPAERCKCVC